MPTYDVTYCVVVTKRKWESHSISAESEEQAVEDLRDYYKNQFGDEVDEVDVEIAMSDIREWKGWSD